MIRKDNSSNHSVFDDDAFWKFRDCLYDKLMVKWNIKEADVSNPLIEKKNQIGT